MKIAFILPHFYPYVGGGEKMFYDMAVRLSARGHEVRVVARSVGKEYSGHKRMDGIDVWYCNWKEMFGHPFVRRADIEKHIKWCDIVHTSTYTTAPITSKLARKYNKKSVITIYEVRGNKWYWCDNFVKATIYNLVEQYSCRQHFDACHSISYATERDIKRFIKAKNVRTVYIANEMKDNVYESDFSLRSYFNLPEDAKVFLYYGRPGKTKGVQVYEKAIEELLIKRGVKTNYRFCFILGKEPVNLRTEFVKLIKEKGLEGRVLIRDSVRREDLSAAISQADCVVVPSVTEGFGFSALEACQLGAPLIYSDGGSLPEVAYGECMSFRNRDYKDLANKLNAVICHGEKAFSKVAAKEFTYEAMIEGIEKIYKECLGSNKK